ncbi:MAG: hypothetical protein IPM81_05065 [Saprospirales bacterium]|nr:hypothetical protein [Saprospirales bacterium]
MQKSVLLFGMLLVAHFGWAQSLKPIAAKVYQAKQQSADFSKTSLFSQAASVTTRPELAGQWAKGLLVQPDREKIRDLRGNAPDRLEISLPDPDGGALQLELVRAQVFSQEFTVRQASDRNAPVVVDPGLHYWGIVKDQPHTLAGISIFESDVVGIVYAGTEKLVFADLEQDPSGIHIIYRERDLASRPGFECMSEMLEDVSDGAVAQDRSTGPDNCVRMYMEADYTIFQNKGSVAAATTYIESLPAAAALPMWMCYALACYGVGYSGINTTYSNVPTYSWTVEVVTHEIGHNLGSQHTHACAWNGNNTAIDGCGPAAGYSEGCNAALPTAGTIMSYCHLVSGVGIDLNLGFGPQPGDRIRNEVYNAACLAACGGGGPCSYGPVNSQNFDGGWGSGPTAAPTAPASTALPMPTAAPIPFVCAIIPAFF